MRMVISLKATNGHVCMSYHKYTLLQIRNGSYLASWVSLISSKVLTDTDYCYKKDWDHSWTSDGATESWQKSAKLKLMQFLRLLQGEELLTLANEGLLQERVRSGSKSASERSEWATWRGYYSCCTICSLLHYNLLCLDFWILGWPTFKYGRPTFKWDGPISGERVLEIRPPPTLSSHLSSSPMGIFSRAYGMHVQKFELDLGQATWKPQYQLVSAGTCGSMESEQGA